MNGVAASVTDQGALIRRIPLFAGLSDAEVTELWGSAERVTAAPGETVIAEGDPGDAIYIILSGALEVTKRDGARDITLATRRAGEVLGEMSLLEQAPRSASVRAVAASELLVVGPEAFRRLLSRRPEAATSLLRTVVERLRSTEASLIQSDKLAALGTLAAGLAHELNNPAAAIQRSAASLSETFDVWLRRTAELGMLGFGDAENQAMAELERSIANCQLSRQADAIVRQEEDALITRLETLGVEAPWDVGPALATYGWTEARLDQLAQNFEPDHFTPVLQWLGAGLAAQQLMEEIQLASKAISGIVEAVKSYAYLDQAPVQNVDLKRSLEDTLTILNHKLKHGIEVVRRFEADLPLVEAYAGELNQVWTNIIDNAVQAMDGKGRLEIGARRLGRAEVEVCIADRGPGIPKTVAARIFEPFFTTKAQGVGTGLGLHIAHNIVVNRHLGRITFETGPGHTEFRIVLPVRLSEGVKPAA